MLDGAAGVPVKFAVKPNDVLAFGPRLLFQEALFIVASDPDEVSVPFQPLLRVSPSGITQFTVHPNSVAVVGFFTVTWAWKPPGQAVVTA